MKFISLAAALAAAIPAAFALTVNSPASVVECEPTQLEWNGGTSPYYLSLVPAGQTAATPIKQFPTQNGTSYTWNVDLASGVSFTISLKDSTGQTAYSSIITVQAGPDASCVNSTVQEGSGSGSSGSTSSSVSASGSSAGATGTSSGKASSSSTSSAPGSTSTHSGASHLGVSTAFGVAGVMGLVGAMLF